MRSILDLLVVLPNLPAYSEIYNIFLLLCVLATYKYIYIIFRCLNYFKGLSNQKH